MRELTLNKCLNKLATILFGNVEDSNIIVKILNDVRIYVIGLTRENVVNSNREKIFMVTLKFIIYMIPEMVSGTMTNQFLHHCNALRSIILKLGMVLFCLLTKILTLIKIVTHL